MASSTASAIIGPMRVPFLLLAPVCVLLGAACAVYLHAPFRIDHLLLILVGAVSAHISVNAFNEYDDFRTGLDYNTTRTPFSGGSGALPEHPDKAVYALVTGVTAMILTLLIGIFFVAIRGFWLLPIGIVGVLSILSYTRWLTRSPLLCLLAPGVGFGPCIVLGTVYALTGEYSWTAAAASLVPFFLVSDLLLLNQFPDVGPDAAAGRRHLMIARGKRTGATVYAVFMAGAYLSVLGGWIAGWFPPWALLALLTLAIALPTVRGVIRHAEDDLDHLLPCMARNVLLSLSTPLLMAAGLVIGALN